MWPTQVIDKWLIGIHGVGPIFSINLTVIARRSMGAKNKDMP